MKVFLDARAPFGGIGRHVRWLGRSLEERLGSAGCVTYGGEGGSEAGPPGKRSLPRAAAGALKRIVVDQRVLPQLVARSRAEVFHSPNHLVPRQLSIPAVLDCYDLTLVDHFDTKKRGPMKHYERRELLGAIERARCVVTPSRAVRRQLLERFDLDPDRVVAIYPVPPAALAFPPVALPADDERLPDAARAPFFLSVGTLEPRKNLSRLLDAHERIWPATRIPLLLVGPYGWRQRGLLRRIARSRGAVRWLGWVPDDLLGLLYRRATAVVQASLAEGFDLPVLEAMTAGAPLVLSELAVHREVAGDLALFASVVEVEALADRMSEILLWDSERRSDQARQAAARVAALAQNSGIDLYLEVYRQALEG